MTYTVNFRRRAQADISTQMAWLESTAGLRSAYKWRLGLLNAALTLEKDPNSYPRAEEADDLAIDLREMLHGRRRHVYRILFTVDNTTNTVNIHRVRHAAQDWLKPGDL